MILKKTLCFTFVFLCFGLGLQSQARAFEVPKLTGPVMDTALVMDSRGREELESFIRELNRRDVAQLQVLTVPSLDGEPIEAASIRVTDAWKLGTARKDNGVLLLVATEDRKVRIEVGQGLEGDLTDAYARRIIDRVILPQFRARNYNLGIQLGIYEMARKVDPDFSGNELTPKVDMRSKRKSGGYSIFEIILFIVVLIFFGFFRGMRSGHRSGWYGGSGGLGGGGFGGGGGSWGGGGGGFSGGGASGNW